MAIAIYLEPERTPSRYSHVAQPQILVDEIHVVVQAFTIVWLQVCLVRLLVMPRLVATTGLHRGQNAHQSRLFSTLVQHLFDPFLLAELLLTSNKFDLDSVFVSDTLHVLPNGLAQRLCPLRVVENADLVLVEVVRHALGVAPLWNRPLDDDPVVAGKNASDLALVPLGQEFDAHSGIITDILFGSGYAGLGFPRHLIPGTSLISSRWRLSKGHPHYVLLPRPSSQHAWRAASGKIPVYRRNGSSRTRARRAAGSARRARPG